MSRRTTENPVAQQQAANAPAAVPQSLTQQSLLLAQDEQLPVSRLGYLQGWQQYGQQSDHDTSPFAAHLQANGQCRHAAGQQPTHARQLANSPSQPQHRDSNTAQQEALAPASQQGGQRMQHGRTFLTAGNPQSTRSSSTEPTSVNFAGTWADEASMTQAMRMSLRWNEARM